MAVKTVYDEGKNRMVGGSPVKRQGGRFGGPAEQHIGKAGRGGMKKSAPRLTISDYDKARV